MQLVGGMLSAVVACYGMIFLIAMLQGAGRGGAGSFLVWIVAILATSLARSVAHANAGRRLLYDGPGTPASALKRYITIAWVQTGVVAGALLINSAPSGLMLALVLILGGWPLALLIVAKPRIEAFGDAVPMSDDKGFEGASILLLIFGSIGVCIGAIMLLGWTEWPGELKTEMIGVGMLVAYVMLLIRSIFHLRAGIRGVKATHMAETAEAAVKYGNFGVVAAFVAGGVLLIGTFTAMPEGGSGIMMFVMMMMVAMLVWVLLIWPVTIRRFFSDRQFATMVDGLPGHQNPSDRGLPTLGWLLLAFGVYALATGLGGVLMGDLGDARAMRSMSRGDNPLGMIMGLMGSVGGKSPWFGIVVAALQVWAGFELIRLSPRYKLAGMVFGLVASGVALYIYLPLLNGLMQGGMTMMSNPMASMSFASVAMALVVPVATLVLVQRNVTDREAIARTFE